MNNEHVARILDEFSRLSAFEHKHKAASYEKAANTVRSLQVPLREIRDLTILNGVGGTISRKIREILRDGRCRKLRDLRRKYGHLIALTDVPGIGPSKARELYAAHGAKSIDDVRNLIKDGLIKDKRIIVGVTQNDTPMTYQEASEKIRAIQSKLTRNDPHILSVDACGSFRRCERVIGDIDIVIQSQSWPKSMKAVTKSVDVVVDMGDKKVTGIYDTIQIDFRFSTPKDHGAMLLYFTGDKHFNIRMRKRAISREMMLNEYGLHRGNEIIASRTEEDILRALDVDYLPPEFRTEKHYAKSRKISGAIEAL